MKRETIMNLWINTGIVLCSLASPWGGVIMVITLFLMEYSHDCRLRK